MYTVNNNSIWNCTRKNYMHLFKVFRFIILQISSFHVRDGNAIAWHLVASVVATTLLITLVET